jgi:hypothetical protein
MLIYVLDLFDRGAEAPKALPLESATVIKQSTVLQK